jgi:hypothetical protein
MYISHLGRCGFSKSNSDLPAAEVGEMSHIVHGTCSCLIEYARDECILQYTMSYRFCFYYHNWFYKTASVV